MDYFDWYAAYLHRTSPVADGHRDLVTDIYRRRQDGETGILNKYYKREWRKSGVNLIFASLYLGSDELEDCREGGVFPQGAVLKKAMEMLAAFYADLEETKGKVQLVTDRDSLLRITAKRGLSRRHRTGILLFLEGLDMIEGESELLRCFYAMGVRGASLTWNERKELPNVLAKGCGETFKSAGGRKEGVSAAEGKTADPSPITDKGVQALFLMERLGIFVDSSHLCREAAWLLPAFTKKPFAATHSNAAAVKGHVRNLTEEEIKEISVRGGVIGVNGYKEFNQCIPEGGTGRKGHSCEADSLDQSGICALCAQIFYLLKAAGEDCVGLGLDLGEGNFFADTRELPALTAELLRRGLAAETVKKILGGNWIRYLLQTIQR